MPILQSCLVISTLIRQQTSPLVCSAICRWVYVRTYLCMCVCVCVCMPFHKLQGHRLILHRLPVFFRLWLHRNNGMQVCLRPWSLDSLSTMKNWYASTSNWGDFDGLHPYHFNHIFSICIWIAHIA